jgi:hypothetical protein
VDKNILATIPTDEAVPLYRIKPLYGSNKTLIHPLDLHFLVGFRRNYPLMLATITKNFPVKCPHVLGGGKIITTQAACQGPSRTVKINL